MDATSDRPKRIIELAEGEARAHNHDFVGTGHILLGLLDLLDKDGGIGTLILESQISPESQKPISLDDIRRATERAIVRGRYRPSGRLPFTREANTVLRLSRAEAAKLNGGKVETGHILLGLLREGHGVAGQVLTGLGVSENLTRELVIQFTRGRQGRPLIRPDGHSPGVERPGPSMLDRFCSNLTQQAGVGALYPALGRDQEIAELMQALSRSSDGCPLLIADAADRMTVLAGLAQRIVSKKAPPGLLGKQLYYGDPDAAAPGELLEIINEAQAREDVVLAVKSPTSAATESPVRPVITSGTGRIIGLVSPEDYRRRIETDDVVGRRFQPVHVAGQSTAYAIGKLQIALRASAQGSL
jgi:ATP-dependent Clp protease ATP-binding subunit ClpC